MDKLRIGLLFGGRSVEHEVSLASATSILGALDPEHYDVTLIAIDPEGRWHLGTPALPPEATVRGEEVNLPAVPGDQTLVSASGVDRPTPGVALDVIFPIIHGQGGEDGTLQGLLELAGVAYVGAGVLGSAVQMDKEVSKRLLRAAGLPVVPWLPAKKADIDADAEATAARLLAEADFEPPVFVKPANLGSSVGIARVETADDLPGALRDAARYDTKILLEPAVDAREIEVALLGNDPIEASLPGEICTQNAFYDYEAKYVDEATELLVPAPLSEKETQKVRALAAEAGRVLETAGLGRVDFLLDRQSGVFYINEVNSLPGFTEGSMFPRLWNASGLPYPALLDRLVELALERHRIRRSLETRFRT